MSCKSPIIDARYTPENTQGVTLICRKCNVTKNIVLFAKDSAAKSGYRRMCLECTRAYNDEKYAKADPIKRREALRRWQDTNRDYVNAYARKRRNPEEEFVLKGRAPRFNSVAEANKASNDNYHANKKHFHEYQRIRNQRPDIKAQRAAYELRRCRENLHHRIKCHLAKRINLAIKETKKVARTMDMTGCDIVFLKRWLEHQFWNGMTWENYSHKGWHIDHIRPCASFDLTDPEQQKQCFHWTNLQPLWAKYNLAKSDNILPAIDYQI